MSKQKKRPFHLLITDNETGKTVQELDFDAIIGAAHIKQRECAGIVIARCSPMAHAETAMAVERTVKELENRDPMVGLALLTARATTEVTVEPENQEENEEKGE